MTIKDLGTNMDRQWRIDLNDNFRELSGMQGSVNDAASKAKAAEQLANEAKVTANNANNTSNSVQEQLNQVVINGDSSIEAAQARVDENGNAYQTLKARLDDESIKKDTSIKKLEKSNSEVISVKAYGAKGDGTDDTVAIQSAIDACPPGGTVVFPTPSVKYRLNSTIIINKPIKLSGSKSVYEFQNGKERANILEFANTVKTGIKVESYNVNIKDFTILMTSITADTFAGIHLNGDASGFMRHNTISNIEIVFGHIYGSGVRGNGVLVTYLDNIHTWQGEYGFRFDGSLNTSINFHNTWARNHIKVGYYLENTLYCSLMNTTSDSVNKPDHGYKIINSSGISLYGSACEHVTKSYLSIDNSKEITAIGFVGVFGNENGSGSSLSSFSEIVNNSKQITFIGCRDYNANTLNSNSIFIDANSNAPISINCDFGTGINRNGTITPTLDPTLLYTKMNFGMTELTDNPKGSGTFTVSGRHLATVQKRLGILKDDYSGWKSYLEADGSLYLTDAGSLPAASATYRGTLRWRGGVTGVADGWYVCIKNELETYEWKKITLS